jgi:predicted NBD/HSP70 family sugar kinase
MVPRDLYPLSSAEPPFFVGIDLGGTNIKSGVVDNQGQILGYAHLERSNVGPKRGHNGWPGRLVKPLNRLE